jgi:hypothetical protein
MSWGSEGGEELRERAKTELALVRSPLYKLSQTVSALQHPDKGPELRGLVSEAYAVLDRIEYVLNR